MAGDWIKWDKGLTRKPKILALARVLQCSRWKTAALCMEFWEWADDVTRDGEVRGVTLEDIDAMIGVEGFANALTELDWITMTEQGIQIPKFSRHNGQPAKARALGQARATKRRADGCNDDVTPL